MTDALRYDAWGELIASTTSALPTPWRYQGRLDVGPDAANPLYDFGARDYRPVTGAFTSLDSYAGQAIDPLSMNRFLYAEANPATFVDPTGHGVECGLGEQCSATDRSNDLAASAARTAPKPKPRSVSSGDAAETAHIAKIAGGAAPTVPPSSKTWQDLTDRCLTGNKLDPAVGAACDAVEAGPVDLSLDRIGPILHDDLVAISVTTGGTALVAATGSLVLGPGALLGEGAAIVLEGTSLATGSIATGADCLNHHDPECAIGVASLLAGGTGFGFRGLGAARVTADDVVRAVNWFSQLGANGLTLGGVLDSVVGAPER
ncbi:MAG: RHS repeat-associated core domain-containing protein [Chloroflexota bacterium]|nr:MAG: RHS repeat-associated core domain-containing protein [Chloroflexota bacterium]